MRVFAQTIALGLDPTIFRYDPNDVLVPKRTQQVNFPEAINLDDCRKDIRIRIPVTMTGFNDPSLTVQAWASTSGNDCTVLAARQNATRTCWRVTPNDIPRFAIQNIDIRAQDIIGGSKTTNGEYFAGKPDICGTIDITKFAVTFMFLKNNGSEVVSSVVYNVDVDTIGPDKLVGLEVTPGDTRISVKWAAFGSAEGGTTSAQNVNIYYAAAVPRTVTIDASSTPICEDASTDLDAGAIADASCQTINTGGGTATLACTAPGFNTGGLPPESTIPKITVGIGSSQGLIEGLENGTSYAVTVAATDPYLNAGKVDDPICATPEVLDDFFETYRNAGGQAGGGLCTLNPATWPGEASAGLICATFAATSIVMRRRRNARKQKGISA